MAVVTLVIGLYNSFSPCEEGFDGRGVGNCRDIDRLSHVRTNFLEICNIDILVAYQGELDPKQPNLKSVSESEVSFPVKRPYVRKVIKSANFGNFRKLSDSLWPTFVKNVLGA